MSKKTNYKRPPPVATEIQKQIIEYWTLSTTNTVPYIALKFKLPERQVHRVIDNYLSRKNLP